MVLVVYWGRKIHSKKEVTAQLKQRTEAKTKSAETITSVSSYTGNPGRVLEFPQFAVIEVQVLFHFVSQCVLRDSWKVEKQFITYLIFMYTSYLGKVHLTCYAI